MLRMKSLAADEKQRSEQQKQPVRADALLPGTLPDSEMLSQKGESNSY